MCKRCDRSIPFEKAKLPVKRGGKYGYAVVNTCSDEIEVYDSKSHNTLYLKIKYCPWCGRKL